MDIRYGTAHVFFQEILTLGARGELRRSQMLGVEDNRLDSILKLLHSLCVITINLKIAMTGAR